MNECINPEIKCKWRMHKSHEKGYEYLNGKCYLNTDKLPCESLPKSKEST